MKIFFRKWKKMLFLFALGSTFGFMFHVLFFRMNFFNIIRDEELSRLQSKETSALTCLIIVQHNHNKYLNASKDTWLRGCDIVFAVKPIHPRKAIQSKRISSLETYLSKIKKYEEGQSYSGNVINITGKSAWSILCKSLHLAKLGNPRWVIISPDNLFIMIENLKYYTSGFNWLENHYLGYALKNEFADYNTLMAGILLSGGTLSKLLKVYSTEEDCDESGKNWKNEDFYLGRYLKHLGIFPKDTRDEDGRGLFHGYNVNTILKHGKLFDKSDYKTKALYPSPEGFNCCSPHSITFDMSGPDHTYYNYYMYTMKPKKEIQKVGQGSEITLKNDGFSWRDFLKEEGYSKSAIDKITAEEYYEIWAKKINPESFYESIRKVFGLG